MKSKFNIEQLPTINILDLLPGFNEIIDNYTFLNGTSLIIDIMLLKALARTFNHCEYLEIGSWRGESISNVADVAKNCTAITFSEEEMRALNLSEDFIRVHGIFSKNRKNIVTFKNNSQTFDFSKLDKTFDLIFIDGDHSYEGVLKDSRSVFPLRKNKNSIIVWHDYGLNTEQVRSSVLNGILDGIPKEKHHNLFHVSNTLCAIYIEGTQFHLEQTKFPSYPNKKFKIHLEAKNI